MGYMYERGLGAPASDVRAERHYRRAAELLAASDNAKEGLLGEWHVKATLYASLGALRLRRLLRYYGFDFLFPVDLF